MANGVDAGSVNDAKDALEAGGAVVRLVGPSLAKVESVDNDALEPDVTFETAPSVVFDAVVVPDGAGSADELGSLGQALEFLRDQYRHCKAILLLGAGDALAEEAGVPVDDESDWAIVRDVDAFVAALGKHRNWDRQIDPPPV
jgi:catalase